MGECPTEEVFDRTKASVIGQQEKRSFKDIEEVDTVEKQGVDLITVNIF